MRVHEMRELRNTRASARRDCARWKPVRKPRMHARPTACRHACPTQACTPEPRVQARLTHACMHACRTHACTSTRLPHHSISLGPPEGITSVSMVMVVPSIRIVRVIFSCASGKVADSCTLSPLACTTSQWVTCGWCRVAQHHSPANSFDSWTCDLLKHVCLPTPASP